MESRPVAATLPFYRAPPYGHAAHSKSCFTHRFTQYFGIIFSLDQKEMQQHSSDYSKSSAFRREKSKKHARQRQHDIG
jgi:hypothetical protein